MTGLQALHDAASFRDPAGHVYWDNGVCKRTVTSHGISDYRLLLSSGLYDNLVSAKLLIPHHEEPSSFPGIETILVPEHIPYISYPYEWSFSQLRDAALLTLEIQRRALGKGLSLKDASAFNVQFQGSQPVFIDTLSFEPNRGGPWVAYQQFCRHFLAPLLLMVHADPAFNRNLATNPDGFPLATTSRLLPLRTYLQPGPLLHIHLHSRADAQPSANAARKAAPQTADRKAALTDSLRRAIQSVRLPNQSSVWSGYYAERTHYSEEAETFRQHFVTGVLRRVQPNLVFDLGANRGNYSKLTADLGFPCVAFEADPICADRHYLATREAASERVLSLCMDLRYPSPAIGFACRERDSLLGRPRAGLVLALALVHHLRISGQAPLVHIAGFLASLGDHLLLEFVPKSDPMVQTMLAHREDIFEDYTIEGLAAAMSSHWELLDTQPVPSSHRTLHLYRRRR